MRARRFSDCMHVRSTAVSEIRTLDMHARARFQRSNSVMHVFTVMHDQLCMMRALFNTSFTRILLALLLATSQTIGTVAIEIVRRSKLRVSGLKLVYFKNFISHTRPVATCIVYVMFASPPPTHKCVRGVNTHRVETFVSIYMCWHK